jgi:hypothetical protein
MKYLKPYESFLESKEENKEETKGILYQLSNEGNKTLILLPGAGKDGGQGDDDFQALADDPGNDFSVYTADFPNQFNVRDYANKIAKEIEADPNIKTCAVGGFSIGGAIAWHLAGALAGSKKFNNQLFFIDSGIPDSTEEFAIGIVKGNTPRAAMATPMGVIRKARSGVDSTEEEEKSIKRIYTEKELVDFRKANKGNYIEYLGKDFPPDNTKLDAAAKVINEKTPDEVYIIEDKYDTTNFKERYSVMPKEVESMTFKKGDVINLINFVEQDTLKKLGLGRETTPIEISELKMDGTKKTGEGRLPKLEGVEVISLLAGNKEGKAKPKEDIASIEKEVTECTTGKATSIIISGTEHGNITKSKELANKIKSNYKNPI